MKKSYLLISLILVMILAVSAVSAADNDVTSDLAESQVSDEVVSTPAEEPVVTATDDPVSVEATPDSEVLKDPGDKNFTQLQQEIDDAPGMLNIESNYVRQDGEQDIVITKSISIYGNDVYKIDANGLGGIFKINQGLMVFLQNVVLVNGNADEGGAIYNEGTTVIISSQISNSKATEGGAVYNEGTVSISGSTLDGNTAIEHGGAVYNIGTAMIDTSTFENNEVTKKGGAYGGAAVFNDYGANKLEISGSNFINNVALWTGSVGAVASWATGNVKIKNSYFAGNVARWGGAVEFENLNQESAAIENCTFYNNTGYQGGAVAINDGARYVNIVDSTFESNTYKGPAGAPTTGANGAAISVGYNVPVTLELTNSIIKDNKGDDSNPSAGVGIRLSDYATGIITGCTFENNRNGHGTAINVGTNDEKAGGLILKDSKFINSIADENIMLFINPNVEASIENCTFENNGNNYTIDNKGNLALNENTIEGTIFNKGTITTPVIITVLNNETVDVYEDAVITATVTDNDGNSISDSSFKFVVDGVELDATYDEINEYYKVTYALPSPGIYNVTAISPNCEQLTVKNGTIKNYRGTFTELQRKVNNCGGQLELQYNFKFTPELGDSEYANGIYVSNTLNVVGNGYTIDANDAARIFDVHSAPLTLDNLTLCNGNADKGGAIYGTGDITITNTTFAGNGAANGGAIYTYGSNVKITDCVFSENIAGTNGGAIYIPAGTSVEITTSKFEDNIAFGEGNAIYNLGSLALSKNTISTEQADIVSAGEITSQINVTTYDATVVYGEKVNLTATITDDNANLIDSTDFYFVVNEAEIGPAVYNATSQKYEFEQEFTLVAGIYEITMKNSGIADLVYVQKGKLTATPKKGTYTDLQYQINNAKDGVLDLPYNFTYDADYDGVSFMTGVNIVTNDLTINGNNNYIDGNNQAGIFSVAYGNVNINDVEFRNGNCLNTFGAIDVISANLNIDNCTFTDCIAPVIYNYDSPIQLYVIYDEASYDAVLAIENGPLQKYYAQHPTEDVDENAPRGHSWAAVQAANLKTDVSELPWVVLNMDEPFTGTIYAFYAGEEKFGPWSVTDKGYAIISVTNPGDMGMKEFALWGNTTYGNASDFNPDSVYVEMIGDIDDMIYNSPVDPVVTITDSTFKGEGIAIRNEETISLYGNTIEGYIYNNGNITSPIYSVVLSNKTISVPYGVDVSLNATLTDVNGNRIYDPNLKFTVNGVVYNEDPVYNVETGLYTLDNPAFSFEPQYVIDVVTGEGNNLNTEIGIINNPLAGTYTDLAAKIEEAIANNDGVLNLTYDFAYNEEYDSAFEYGITPSAELTINGNNHTIDAKGLAYQTFSINHETVLNGITFKNNYQNVILCYSELTVNNCTFVDNHEMNDGIIYIDADAELNIADSIFANNSGGVIYNLGGSVSVNNTKFINNTVEGICDASVIYNYEGINLDSWLEINNCEFINNSASSGGAIYNGAVAKIYNSVFDNNDAIDGEGGAIYNNGILRVYDSNFTKNSAPYDGGAIYTDTDSDYSVWFIGCVFEQNDAFNGGAIKIPRGEVSIENSNFTDNGVYDIFSFGTLELSGNNIANNKAGIYNGGVITTEIKVTVLDNDTVFADSKDAELYATITDDNNNVIYDTSFSFIINGNEVKADFDGENLYTAYCTLPDFGFYPVSMISEKDENNIKVKDGVIAYITGTYTDLQMKINEAIDAGYSTLYLPYDFTYNPTIDGDLVEGIVILQDLTINGNNHYIDANNTADLLTVAYSNVNINDVEFKNAHTIYEGLVDIINSNLNIDNCTFTNCSASGDGSVICNIYYPVQLYIVYDEASYDAVLAIDYGPLQKYYEEHPEEDVDENDPRGHSWAAVKAANLKTDVSELPWVVIDMGIGFTGTIYADYGGVQKFGPWNVVNKTYGIISVTNPGDMGMKEFALWGNTTYGNASDFNPKSVSVRMDSEDGDHYLLYDTPIDDPVVTITNSKFDCGDSAVIENQATLSLQGNTIVGSGYIYNNGGIITSPLYSTVLDNKSVTPPYGEPVILNATLTDDNGNNIFDEYFAFTLNRHTPYGMTAKWDSETGLYTSEFAFDFEWHSLPMYVVSVNAFTEDLTVKTGIINNPVTGTFTELQALIAIAVEHNDSVLGLDYDFTYTPEIDGDNFPNGVLINQSVVIIGNGHTITANNTSRNIFTVKEGITATLTNVTLTGVNMTANKKYGAVVNHGNLTIDNCTFKDNAINKVSSGNGGAAVFNTGTSLIITGSKFINNTAPWSGSTGAVSSWVNSYLLIENSYFEGNLARFGAAIEIEELDQKEVAVRNCTFFNNSGYSGVSINANANVKYLNVTNCTFDSNNFHGPQGAPTTGGMGAGITAGTARKVPVTLEVSDCIFKNNSGDDEKGSVGAAIRLADRASGIITNCTFENNYGTKNVAIASGTMNNDSATLTVKDSTFIGNDATNGITVMIDYNIDASIENCDFSADANDIAIYNSGTLSLSKNTVDSLIYNRGTITSETNVTVLRNGTVNAKYGQIVTLNATYTDDNGNSIYDPNFNFTVEGVSGSIPATYTDGVYMAEYKVDQLGEKIVSAVLGYDVTVNTGLLDLSKAHATLTIEANDTIKRKQNETVTINLVDEFGNLLNLTVEVSIKNSTQYIYEGVKTTENGTVTFELSGLPVDTYTILAYLENDYYHFAWYSKVFEVTELDINGTYTELQKLIDETPENGTLVLPYNFAYIELVDEDNFPSGVIINKTIAIDGNGSTISGSKVYRIFNITAGNVVFNNITFVDGIADNGGAIYANSTEDITVTILNSTFANNTATIGGGAVAFMSDDDSKVTYYIIDSLFENNTATGTYKEDESVAGGAIYSEGITDWCYIGFTTFKNNKAIEGNMPNGGAVKVQFGGKLVVLNSTFEDNFAEQAGGAISVQSNTNMNCTVIVLNTKFENNKAGQAGAAVSAIETSGNSLVVIINSTIENNVADITAHAVYVSPRSSVAVINTTLTGNGGATDYGIYNLGKLALINNTISNIVYTNSVYGEGVITTDTYARILENQTIDITSDRYTLVTTLTDDNGNKIYDRNLEFTINGVPIDAVPAYDKESGLYTYVFEIGSERIYVVNVTSDNEKKLNTEVGILRFINGTYTDLLNKINDAEGTLVLPYNFTYTAEIDGDKFPSGVVINKSITIDGNGSTISGNNSYRIFYIASNNVNLTNITFTKGNASGKWGGAIYVNGDYENLTVSDSKFTQNSAGVNGGAIYWAGDKGKLLSSSFMNNTAGASGGAIFWFGDDGYIGNGSSFMMNNATENGGAVAWFTNGAVGGHNGVIDNSTFIMNSAGQNGGAVFWQSPDGTLKNSRFMFMNSATQNGGAVFWFAENGVIDNSSFMMNSINGDLGGALFSQGENLTIKDSSFRMNFAANGGAVALLAKATIDNSTFTFLNSAKNYGGAIYIDSDVSISNSTIAYNNATIGKGIYVNSGKLSLQNNTINNASADIVLSSNAVIVSYVNATILGNTTVDTTGMTVNLTANITDDRGNLIEAPNFKFVINGEEVAAAYNATSKLYEAEYTLPGVGVYPVDMTYTETENLDTYIGIIRNVKGTYTDLQNLIDDADGELILPYDFIYTEEIDGEKFPEGVLIVSPIKIEGNGYTISGNNSYRIFRITAETTINNVTFTNGSAVEFGGAIYTTADLTVSNSTFVNNSVALNDANGGAIAAIADGSEITLNVNNVLFENNCVDNAGGAIAVATMDSKVNYNIYDSEFVDNYAYEAIAASGGAIFSYGNTEGLINNTVFRRNYIDCEDLSNGGAIKLQFGGKLTVANSTFEDNEAEYTGSAISVQADDGKNNVLIVDNCTFTGNSASYGDTITSKQYAGESVVIIKGSTFDSGIFLDELTKASISNSTIENEGYHGIYNLGLLILDKNVVDIIYNNGTILSSVNATLLGNETVPAELYDEVYPFATLTDDNGNPIYDPNFRITVNDVVIEDVEYDYDENVYVSNYTIEKPGDYVVSTLYAAEIYTGIYQVPKANITRFEVIPGGQDNRIPYGENVTVYVVLEGVDGEGLNETFNVIVNNAEYSVTVTNGSGSFNVSGLAPGQYAALGIFPGNDCYNKAYATGLFTVLEPEAKLTVEIADITVGDILIVKVNLTDFEGNPIFGTVEVGIDNHTYSIVVYGNGSIAIADVPAGNYTAVAASIADASHTSVNNTTDFEVKKISEYDFIATAGTGYEYGETVEVDVFLPEDATGNVTITINDVTYNATVEDGKATIEIPGLTIGDYEEVEVLYSGDDNYEPGTTTVDIYVLPIDPEFEAEISFISYGETATIMIEINENATGVISVYSYDYETENQTFMFNITVEEARNGINITDLNLGTNWFDLVYSGDSIFAGDEASTFVDVEPLEVDWGMIPEEDVLIEVNETVTVTLVNVTEGAEGNINITIDGVEYGVYTLDEALAGINITGFDTPGTYTVEVAFIENPNYEYAPSSLSFDVIVDTIDADMNVTVPEDAKVGDTVNITVELPEDASGELAVIVDGVEVANVDVEGGKVIVPVEDLASGEHNVVVIYSGDDKYDTATEETILNVSKVDPTIEIAIDDDDAVVGGSVHVTVTLPDDATNYVLVDVNGMQYFGELEEGVYSFDIDDLEALTYDIEVTYVGDDKYNKATKSANFTVGKSNATIDAILPGEVTVDEIFTVYVTVDPADATGNFSVFIDGVDVSDEYSGLTIIDGEGSFTILGLTAGNHTIGVRYNGDLNYNASEIKTYDINVTKVDVSGDIEIYDVYITYGETATVTFELPDDATGNVTVIVNGVEYTAPLDDGSAVVEISGLDADIYENVAAKYSGDDKYTPYEGVVTIEVAPLEVDWGMEPDEDQFIDVNDTVTVKLVNVTEGAEGNITITIDGVEYGNYTLVEALAGIELTGFDTPGTYTVEVAFIENPNYEYAPSLIFDVIVDTIDADMNVTVPEDAKVGDTVNITVELPEDAAGEVAVFIDGVEVASVDVEGGKVIVPVEDLAAGEHNVVVIYSGDDKYDTATEETVLNVNKVLPTIEIEVDGDGVVGGSAHVTVTLPDDATDYVLVDVNGMQYFGELEEGVYSFDIDDLEALTYDIEVTYVGDDKYNKATKSANFTVGKSNATIDAMLPGEAYVGDFVVVEVTVDPAAATGNYSVFIDGVDVSEQFGDLNINNGKGSFVITALTNGTHTIGVKYNGDNNYEASDMREYTIVINKVDVSGDINIEGSEITYGENATVTFELPDDATGTVTVTINGVDYTADVDGGVAVVEIPGLDAGLYEDLQALYSGDDKYAPYEGVVTIEVAPFDVDWGMEPDEDQFIDVNDTVTVKLVDVTEGAEGNITITIDGRVYGRFTLVEALAVELTGFDTPGTYIVEVAFIENPNFDYADPVDVLVIVRTIDADMNVTLPSDAEAGSPSEITVELPQDATGNVTVIVDGKEVATAPVEDGKATVEVPGLTAGNHTVDVVYSGDDTYSPAIVSDNLTVNKANATVVGEADDITIGEDATIIITVPSDAKGVVLVDIDGQSLYGNIVDGKATVTVSGLTAGEKTATITLTSDDKYAETSNTTTFTVNKVKEYDMSVNSTTPREGQNATVTVELPSDANGNVTVTDSNGNSVTVPVENGKATVEVPGLTEGENNVTVTYSGDDKYDSKSENTTVNVKPALINTVLSAEKLEMYVGDGSKFQAKLLDEDGNPVANRGIKVTICGKTYTIKTNSSGIAVLPINLKAGSYPTTLVFNGDSQYNASNVVSTSVEVYTKVRITENKDLVKTYGGSEKFTVRALDKYGKPVGAYAKVKMTIAGKTYTVNTDSNGYASLPINLKAGTYQITTEYGGTTVFNTVTVKSK